MCFVVDVHKCASLRVSADGAERNVLLTALRLVFRAEYSADGSVIGLRSPSGSSQAGASVLTCLSDEAAKQPSPANGNWPMFPDTPARHMAREAEAAGKGARGATPSKGPKVDSDGFGSSQFRGVTWQKIGAKNKSDQNFFK